MPSRWKTNITWIALAVGVVLLVGAIMMAATQVNWEQLKQAEPWQVAALVAAVLVNLVISTALWWSVTLSFDAKPKVRFAKMFALVCASGLLNYLPLRPGLFGRAAYLKMKHNLPLRQSAWILVLILGLSGLVLGGAAAIVQFVTPEFQYEVALAAAVLATFVTPIAAARLLRRKVVAGWLWVPVRIADVLVSAARLWVVFEVVGEPIGYGEAVLAASAGLFVSMLGITPNGLGLREWAIAGVTSATSGHVGFAAAVIDRGVEAVVVTLAGLWAMQHVSLKDDGGGRGSKGV